MKRQGNPTRQKAGPDSSGRGEARIAAESAAGSGRRLTLALAVLVLWAVVSRYISGEPNVDMAEKAAVAKAEDNLGITAARQAATVVEAEERARLGPAKGAPKVKGARKPRTFPANDEVNILEWMPPRNAPDFDKALWKDKVDAVWAEVRAFELGGPPLRKFISEKVAGLRALRENLFAFVPVEENDKEAL